MRHVTDSTTLAIRLEAIRKITDQFTKEDSGRSPEQLVAEIEFIKGLLDETKNFLVEKNNLIP